MYGHRDKLAASRCCILAVSALLLCVAIGSAASRPTLQGRGGAIAASEAAATAIGLEVLRHGGNAVDAAIATALALAVVHPEAGNLGGGGFAVVRIDDELASLDFREVAPAGATADLFLDSDGRPIANASLLGPLAAGVPGTPKGLWVLHNRFGRLPWEEIVLPAARLAGEGFEVTRRTHDNLTKFSDELSRFPGSVAVWLANGHPPAAGDTMTIPALARALADYAAEGPSALMDGQAAAAIEQEVARYGGILTAVDLTSYEPVWRPVLRFEAFGWSFASMDLPSSGGIILGQCLRQLEAMDWQDLPRFGAARAHLLAEVLRRSFADRYLLGDPSTTVADADLLLSESWLDQRRAGIRRDRATPSAEVVAEPALLTEFADDTTHLAVVDADGNAVSLTTTLNTEFGCKLLVPELGFFLNNEMDDFATAPGEPNEFGLVQGEANAVGPGKRMLSSMTPTLAWRRGEILALGGRGGSRIPTATLQVVLNIIVDHDPLQTAIDRPRIHHQWLPDILHAEPDALSPETRIVLEQFGHLTEVWAKDAKINATRWLPEGRCEAAADPRGPAVAGVVEPIP